MNVPDQDMFIGMAAESGLVPVYRTIITDLETPLTIYAKVGSGSSHSFLFESMEGGEKWGRYSFIGLDPLVTLHSYGDRVTIAGDGGRGQEVKTGTSPLQELRDLLAGFNAGSAPELPRFYGGAVGFLGYDMVRFIEEIPDENPALNMPDCSFMVPRLVLIHDAVLQQLTIVCNVVTDSDPDHSLLYRQAVQRIDEVVHQLRRPLSEDMAAFTPGSDRHEFSANMDQASFAAMVRKAKEYILAGDIIQVVLSQRFRAETSLDPFVLYRALRHINPSPYLFYLRLDDMVLIGSSPEILVRLEAGDIELRPIAGTRRRGANEEEDRQLEVELLADPKERAEHLMLVDLGRNDVGRVAAGGSVYVDDLLVIERYSHVMHIVSGVHGTLKQGKDQFDVMEACFPAGTVSGAPKIRAMEIIDELEPERRGPYAGAVGYFGFSGNMDFCITIRTMVLKGRDLLIQAGAGIVADSVPEKEYEETINKAMGLRRAVELAEKGFAA
jgi:anthranilate synthase component 1